MLDRTQNTLGVAFPKSLGMNRFGITPSLVHAITGPTLGLALQRATSTRGSNILARQMCSTGIGDFSQGSDSVEHVAPPRRKELDRDR